jgi:hypothetical protein
MRLQSGGFVTDPKIHSLRGEQREEEINKAREALSETTKQQFPRTQNLEYAILKAHLIVEYALTEYIRGFASTAVDPKDIRFTFSQKFEIAYLLGFGVNDPVLLPTVERLNKVRNQVAHTFVLDRVAVDHNLYVYRSDPQDVLPSPHRSVPHSHRG